MTISVLLSTCVPTFRSHLEITAAPHTNTSFSIPDQCGEPLLCITSKDFIQLQVSVLVMIKIFLDDSLHHTYMYIDLIHTFAVM